MGLRQLIDAGGGCYHTGTKPAKPLLCTLTLAGLSFVRGWLVEYTKSALTIEEQAKLVVGRGLAADRETLVHRLEQVGYYRLAGYWFPFQNPDDTFRPGVTLDDVWQRYVFDRRLRLVVLDAVERFEVALRAQLATRLSVAGGPFGYLDRDQLPNLDDAEYEKLSAGIATTLGYSRERFFKRFKAKYGDVHKNPPYWMLVEMLTFRDVQRLYLGAPEAIRTDITSYFGQQETVFISWLRQINTVRNICAHHGRLWNRTFGTAVKMPDKDAAWVIPHAARRDRMFSTLTILGALNEVVAPQSSWPLRVIKLLDECPFIHPEDMGFPANWCDAPYWKRYTSVA